MAFFSGKSPPHRKGPQMMDVESRRTGYGEVVPPVRVLVADDHQLFAEALVLTLDVDHRVEMIGQAANGKEAVRLATTLRPDVVLMDLEMPVLDGIEATRAVRRALPECHVVVLTASAAPEDAHRARSAGAAAYLTKDCSAADLLDAVMEVAAPLQLAG